MGKDELISKLSTFIRNENFAKIDEIIKKFREDGTLEFSSQFYAGKMEGIYKEYYDSGKILKESYFSNDKKMVQKKYIMKMVRFQVLKTIKMVQLMENTQNIIQMAS